MARWRQLGRRSGLGQGKIVQQSPQRGELGLGKITKSVEVLDAELGLQLTLRRARIVFCARQRCDRRARGDLDRFGISRLLDQQFRRRHGCDFGRYIGRFNRRDDKFARGNLSPGDGCVTAARARQGGNAVGTTGVKQAVLGQGAGCDDPRDIAANNGLCAPGLRRLGVFHLLPDGNLETGLDQARQIGFGRGCGHTTHRDRLALVFTSLGEGDVQRGGRPYGVVKKKLVEIAHPIEKQGIRRGLATQFQELHHHRRSTLCRRECPVCRNGYCRQRIHCGKHLRGFGLRARVRSG